MPTYEYECGACGHAFERFQGINEDPIRTCPECGEDRVRRLISPGGGIVFRGTGFYATDYRRAPSGGKKEGDREGKGKGEGGSAGGKSEAGGDE